ncbi:MAG: ATP-binding protein [Actinobacteria bacterium]|nr:ATP-binding protein [Actinomycetota bacterium]MBV8395753.1 ATP-binding protein [Actinomycetota bacterium]MBV8597678.1 ATP-binding protein [Actinomycetota bacterium]
MGIDHEDVLGTSGDGRVVRLTIPAKAEYIMLGRLALTSLSRVRELSEEELSDLKLALTEACTNAVEHAYGSGDGLVEITYVVEADRLVVEVSDNGTGFSPPEGEPAAPELLEEGGLGIAIIRAVSDELEIGERPGGGSTLRFVKLLSR